MGKDCPVCNGASFEDLIDTPGILDLCLKHLQQWLIDYLEQDSEPPKKGRYQTMRTPKNFY